MWTKGDESSNTMIMNTLNLSFYRPRPWPGLDTQCKKEEEKKRLCEPSKWVKKVNDRLTSMLKTMTCYERFQKGKAMMNHFN